VGALLPGEGAFLGLLDHGAPDLISVVDRHWEARTDEREAPQHKTFAKLASLSCAALARCAKKQQRACWNRNPHGSDGQLVGTGKVCDVHL
jgi:hypothetical protein